MMESTFEKDENIVNKGIKCWLQPFSTFPMKFSIIFFVDLDIDCMMEGHSTSALLK